MSPTTGSSRRVVVVGAGITGLATAHRVLRDDPNAEVVVLEAGARAGGKILTTDFAGRPVDCAADSMLARVPEAVELCHELGLADELVTPASGTAYVLAHGSLQPFPPGLVLGVPTDLDALRRSGVVSEDAVDAACRDLSSPEPARDDDESVGSLVRRRVGDEVYEALVAPLLSGVYAGDADHISAQVATPQFVAALRDHGSLIAGLRTQRAAADPDAPVFYGLRTGMQRLVDALTAAISSAGGVVRRSTAAERLEPRPGAVGVVVEGGDVLDADAVAVTTPDHVTSRLVAGVAREVADDLASVPYASVVLVTFAFDPSSIDVPLDGTGFLVPPREPHLLTACSWASSKWAHLSGERVILRASAGRHGDERAMALTDEQLVEQLVDELAGTMGVRGRPVAHRVSRWPRALPQFPPGHLDRVRRWREHLDAVIPGVTLAGAGIEGLGIPTCIRQANAAARAALERPAR